MQPWQEYYTAHTMTAEEAVKHVKSNDKVVFAHAAAEPNTLVQALMDRKEISL